MEIGRFQTRDDFAVLDLIASFAFKSQTSIGFRLGRYAATLDFPEEDVSFPVEPGQVLNVIGWLDVHHPCEGHIKAQLRVLLPAHYHTTERMLGLVRQVFAALSIPADETYEAQFFSADHRIGIVQATDRHGMSDRI